MNIDFKTIKKRRGFDIVSLVAIAIGTIIAVSGQGIEPANAHNVKLDYTHQTHSCKSDNYTYIHFIKTNINVDAISVKRSGIIAVKDSFSLNSDDLSNQLRLEAERIGFNTRINGVSISTKLSPTEVDEFVKVKLGAVQEYVNQLNKNGLIVSVDENKVLNHTLGIKTANTEYIQSRTDEALFNSEAIIIGFMNIMASYKGVRTANDTISLLENARESISSIESDMKMNGMSQ